MPLDKGSLKNCRGGGVEWGMPMIDLETYLTQEG